MAYEMIELEKKEGVGVITFNRPKALNALCDQLVDELGSALSDLEEDSNIKVAVLTGGEKAFAAGADIKEMKDKTYPETYLEDFITKGWEQVSKFRKPIIAGVQGFALGGGNEVAMMCDFIIAGESAKFGQPEITLGIIPGAGGTQRLTRAVGKAKAMDLCLTGRMMDAEEAERAGLVSRVVSDDALMEEVLKTASKMAKMSLPTLMMAKEAVNKAFETTLKEGVMFERRLFQSTFATQDQKEGMAAFAEKRKPDFQDK